jgi:hypothetical protein
MEMVDARPFGGSAMLHQDGVCFTHSLGNQTCGFACRHARAAASNQRAGQPEERRALQLVLGQSLRPGDDRLTHGLREVRGPQCFLAQADDDDALGRGMKVPRSGRAGVDEDLMRADDTGYAYIEGALHGPADQPVHDLSVPVSCVE